jgi:hypothetical protein
LLRRFAPCNDVLRISPAVITREKRVIQYSRDGRDSSRCRGVLDRPVKPGDDGGIYGKIAGRPD